MIFGALKRSQSRPRFTRRKKPFETLWLGGRWYVNTVAVYELVGWLTSYYGHCWLERVPSAINCPLSRNNETLEAFITEHFDPLFHSTNGCWLWRFVGNILVSCLAFLLKSLLGNLQSISSLCVASWCGIELWMTRESSCSEAWDNISGHDVDGRISTKIYAWFHYRAIKMYINEWLMITFHVIKISRIKSVLQTMTIAFFYMEA